MNQWFSDICRKHADKILIRPSFRYKDIIPLAREKSKDYRKLGVSKGDRIMISKFNSVQFLVDLQALWKIEATPCLVSPKLTLEKKTYVEKLLLHTPKVNSDEEEALLMLTSGTSAKQPKGARFSHSNLLSHITMLRSHIPRKMFDKEDRTFSFLPWTHCYGLMGECFSVMDRGASMSLLSMSAQQTFFFPTFFRDLQFCQPTILFVVPYLLEVILKKDEQLRKLIPNKTIRKRFWFGVKLRYIISGGAHLKPDIRKTYWELFDIEILQGYGCTEMSPMISLQKKFNIKDLSVGEILSDVQVRIENDEIWVNGPNRFLGYVGESSIPFTEFYNTKDRGYIKDNKLYITGRTSNTLKLSNGRFMDIGDLESALREKIPFCQNVCVWQGDDKKYYGIAHVVNFPTSQIISHTYENEIIVKKTCFEEDILIVKTKTSFLSPLDGTLTAKGEMCRPIIRSLYEGLFQNKKDD